MSTDFSGKLAIVTGASKLNGIGFATAYALAKAGADVWKITPYFATPHPDVISFPELVTDIEPNSEIDCHPLQL
jgi:hypothetical protein